MENWDKIKETILFEFLGDWKQIVIEKYNQGQYTDLVRLIEQSYEIIPAENKDKVDGFRIGDVVFYLYQNQDWRIDFNPNQIESPFELNQMIDVMKHLSTRFESRVFLTHEAINDYPLITVDKDKVSFDYSFWDKFKYK